MMEVLDKHSNCPICNKELIFKLSMNYYESQIIEKKSKTSNFVRELQNMFTNSLKGKVEEETKDVIKTQIIEVNKNNLNDCVFSEQGLHLDLINNKYSLDKEDNSITYFDEIIIEANCYNEELQANEYILSGNIMLSEVFDFAGKKKENEDHLKPRSAIENRTLNAIKTFHKLNEKIEMDRPMLKIIREPLLIFEVITLFEVEEDNTISVAKITNLFNRFKTIINIKSNQLDKLNIEQEQKENGKIISSKIEQELTDNSYWKLNNSHRALTRIKTLFALR